MSLSLIDPLGGEGVWTDPFGWRPAVPGVVGPQLHTGADKAAPLGTPVLAAHSGRITRVYVDRFVNGERAGGRMIALGSARCETRYAHLSKWAVRAGDEVKAGDVIGYVGHDGAATGDHLHFELLIGGQFVDPRPYIRKDTPMTKAEMEKLAALVAKTLLDTPVARSDKPKTPTSLRGMITHAPARHLEIKAAFAALTELVKQIVAKLGA